MRPKIFLVEDEIVAREGIRDSIDWETAGYQFCGEAPDGEMALPLILEQRPDIVITDIKMPFMDGLQLSWALREQLPSSKVIILSGHDEFKYAQEAIQIGVTEYLLKPVSPEQLLASLTQVSGTLDRERETRATIQRLKHEMDSQRTFLRERCLLNLISGAITPAEAQEQCRQLELELSASWYQVVVIQCRPAGGDGTPASLLLQQVDTIIGKTLGDRHDVIRLKKDFEETVLILEGADAESVRSQGLQLAALLRGRLEQAKLVEVLTGVGVPADQLAGLPRSFAQAQLQCGAGREQQVAAPAAPPPSAESSRQHSSALLQLLKCGSKTSLGKVLERYLDALGLSEQGTPGLLDYALTDSVLAAAGFLRELGGVPETIIPLLGRLEALRGTLRSREEVRGLIAGVLAAALDYRDSQTHHQTLLVARAKDYIDSHYTDPELSLTSVAAEVMLSPSYFSAVFSREVGESFIEYLTRIRIDKAMELLRTTTLTSTEIGYRVGYLNPRYFHVVFRKVVGSSPIAFRRQARV